MFYCYWIKWNKPGIIQGIQLAYLPKLSTEILKECNDGSLKLSELLISLWLGKNKLVFA